MYSHVRVWLAQSNSRGKLKNITSKCLAMWYSANTWGFRCKNKRHKVAIEQHVAYCNISVETLFHLFPYIIFKILMCFKL